MFRTLSTIVLSCTVAGGVASADLLVFDNSSAATGYVSNRGAGHAPIAFISNVEQPVNLTRIGVLNRLSSDGAIKFLIFRGGATTPEFVSGVQPASASTSSTWKVSDRLSYTLNAGETYYIGAIANVPGFWDFGLPPAGSYTESGITTPTTVNGNVGNFDSPVRGGDGASHVALQLYIPAPGSLALLGLGGLALFRRGRSA